MSGPFNSNYWPTLKAAMLAHGDIPPDAQTQCTICLSPLFLHAASPSHTPVIASCGHVFGQGCLHEHINMAHVECPQCCASLEFGHCRHIACTKMLPTACAKVDAVPRTAGEGNALSEHCAECDLRFAMVGLADQLSRHIPELKDASRCLGFEITDAQLRKLHIGADGQLISGWNCALPVAVPDHVKEAMEKTAKGIADSFRDAWDGGSQYETLSIQMNKYRAYEIPTSFVRSTGHL